MKKSNDERDRTAEVSSGELFGFSRICSKERGCDGKINIGKRWKKGADRMSKKHGKPYGVYSCPHCEGWHLTTTTKKGDYPELIYISKPNESSPADGHKTL